MIKKLSACLICFTMIVGLAWAQGISEDTPEGKIFWSQEVDAGAQWGVWLKEVFKPYSDQLGAAILEVVSAPKDIDPTGKSAEELLAEVSAAYNNSLISMEMIKPPVELKKYHSKIVEVYKRTINADPNDTEQTAVIIEQLSREADQALTQAFQMHGVPERVIYRFTRDY